MKISVIAASLIALSTSVNASFLSELFKHHHREPPRVTVDDRQAAPPLNHLTLMATLKF